MPQSWTSYLDGQEAASYGEFLAGLIRDLAFLMDDPEYANEANTLRRHLERTYENGGAVVICETPAHFADHLTHIHGWTNTNISQFTSLQVIHAAYHTPADEVKV